MYIFLFSACLIAVGLLRAAHTVAAVGFAVVVVTAAALQRVRSHCKKAKPIRMSIKVGNVS